MKKNKIKKLSFVFIIIILFFLPIISFAQTENVFSPCNNINDCDDYFICSEGFCVPNYQWSDGTEGKILCTEDSQCPDGQICELALGYCSKQLQTTEYATTDHSDLSDGIEKEKIKPKKTPDLNPLGKLNVKIPGIDELAAKYPIICNEEEVGKGGASCKIPWIAIYIYAVYNYLLGIGGFLAAIALMIGGVLWLISAGNANRVSQAKSWITGSLTGLIILLTSYVLLYEINPELLGMKYIQMETIEPLDQDAEGTAPSDLLLMSMGINESEWTTLQHDNITNSGMIGHKDMIEVVKRAADCMKLHGYKIRVSSFSRTVQQQAQIYNNNYYTPNTCKGITDKKPKENEACCPFPIGEKICPHNTGHAIDLWGWDPNSTCANKIGKEAQKQLQECMFDEGAYILSSECWHFEYPAISSAGRNQAINFNGGSCSSIKAGTCP